MRESGVNPASWRVLSTLINELATIVVSTASVTNATAWSQIKIACQHSVYHRRVLVNGRRTGRQSGPYDDERGRTRLVTRRGGKKDAAGMGLPPCPRAVSTGMNAARNRGETDCINRCVDYNQVFESR
jgi:hypothetical protein